MGLLNRYKSTMHGNYWKGICKYGLLIGIGLSLVVLVRYWLMYPISQPVSYTENFAMLIFMFLAVFFYKRGLEERKITLKESYILGLGSGIVASIIYGMFLFVYAQYIDVDIQKRCFELQRAVKTNVNLNDEQLMSMVTPSSIAFSGIMLSSVISILWALVVSIFLRNEQGVLITKEMKNLEKEK
jgi:hypothetical protein